MPHSSGPEKRFENVLASRRARTKWAVRYDYCQGKSDVQAIADYEAIPSGPYPLDPLTERFVHCVVVAAAAGPTTRTYQKPVACPYYHWHTARNHNRSYSSLLNSNSSRLGGSPKDPTDPETSPQMKKRIDRFARRGCRVVARR